MRRLLIAITLLAQSVAVADDRFWELERPTKVITEKQLKKKPSCPPHRVVYVDRPVYIPQPIYIRQQQWVLIGYDYHPAFGVYTPRYILQ